MTDLNHAAAPSLESGADGALTEADRETVTAADRRPRKAAWPRYQEAVLGLRGYWYPAFFSKELNEGETRAETVCGERILFKRVDGQVYAVEDRCIHRGVPLSSRPQCHSQNTVTCWLHGFTFDVRDGKLVQILSHPESKLIDRAKIPTYHTRELASTVFVYIGDGEPVPYEEDMPPLMKRSEVDHDFRLAWHPLVRVKINCNWRPAAENGFDDPHVWLHHNAELVKRGLLAIPLGAFDEPSNRTLWEEPGHPKGIGVRPAMEGISHMTWEAQIEDQTVSATVPGGLKDQVDSEGQGFSPREGIKHLDELDEIMATTPMGCMLPGFFMGSFGFPRMDLAHFEWYVPIDEDNHMYTILYAGLVHDDEEEAEFHQRMEEWGPLVFSTNSELEGFNNADVFGREEIHHAYAGENFLNRERLFKGDGCGVLLWRKMVEKHARGLQTRETANFARREPPAPAEVHYSADSGGL